MRTRRSLFAIVSLTLLVAALLVACGATEEAEQAAHDPEEWAALQEAQQTLQAKRQQRTDLRVVIDGKAGEELAAQYQDAAPEDLAAQVESLSSEIIADTDEFVGQLVDFINRSINADAEGTEIHQQAIRMKSDEDLLTGADFIKRGGEYQRAIDIYQQALLFDPDYQALHDAIAEAESLRFMTEERFSQVKKKMAQDEVRELLGPIKGTNIREFPESNAVGWFYRKDNGGAAGVYFREKSKGGGEWVVYETNFDAVQPKVIGGGEGADAEGGEG